MSFTLTVRTVFDVRDNTHNISREFLLLFLPSRFCERDEMMATHRKAREENHGKGEGE